MLPPHHRDPFDRLLVAQGLVEGIPIVTGDRRFGAYRDRNLVVNRPERLTFADDGAIPNHPAFPALVYRGVADGADGADAPRPSSPATAGCPWLAGGHLPDQHHFQIRPPTQGARGTPRGSATVQLGGPGGQTLEVGAGDVLVLPAGTGHCRDSGKVVVVGAYPPGQDWDLRRGDPAEHDEVVANIARVPDPPADPVTGGPISAC